MMIQSERGGGAVDSAGFDSAGSESAGSESAELDSARRERCGWVEASGPGQRRRHPGLLLVLMAAVACGGGAEEGDTAEEPLGSLNEAFTEERCRNAGVDAIIEDGESFSSPETYDRADCLGAQLIDIDPFEFNGVISISDIGSAPTNRAECENIELFAEFFVHIDSAGTGVDDLPLELETRRGAFLPPSLCVVPSLEYVISSITAGLNNDEVEAARRVRAVVHIGPFNALSAGTRPFQISYRDP